MKYPPLRAYPLHALAAVAAAAVKRLLASTVAPELLSPYTPMLSGAALGGTSSPGDVDAVLSGSTTGGVVVLQL